MRRRDARDHAASRRPRSRIFRDPIFKLDLRENTIFKNCQVHHTSILAMCLSQWYFTRIGQLEACFKGIDLNFNNM
jgi:hypothetical protein